MGKEWGQVFYLQDIFQLITDINVFLIVVDLRVVGDEGVLWANVDRIVDLPVDISHLPGRMEETLKTLNTDIEGYDCDLPNEMDCALRLNLALIKNGKSSAIFPLTLTHLCSAAEGM